MTVLTLPKQNSLIRLLLIAFHILIFGFANAQRQIVKTIAGSTSPLDGPALKALFLSPWQIKTKDTLAYISDRDYQALRVLNIKRKTVKTLLINQVNISGLAISRTGDSIFFATSINTTNPANILNLYKKSSQQHIVLDTLPDGDIDALECKRNGFLLIGSANGSRILQRDNLGNYKIIAGKLNVTGFIEGLDTLARFNRISSLVLSQTEDTLYISDRFNSKIRRYIFTTRQVSSLPITLVFGPRQLALSKNKDSLFIANSSGHTIYRHSIKTNTGGHWCGLSGNSGYIDGPAANSRFNFPMGIARCDSGWIICDNTNRRIRMISNGGNVKTFAGVGFLGDGQGLNSRFNSPYDLVKHPKKDTIFITDQNNNAIRMMDLRTNTITTVVGNGTSGNVFGTGSVVRLNRPTNMTISPSGDSLYFVEPFSNKIKLLLTKTAEVKWVAGSDTSGYVDKPIGKFSRFNRPQDLSLKDGFLYVSDANNHKIRKINIQTTAVTTFAGSTSGFKDSTLLGSKFNRPSTLEWVGNRLFVGEDAGLRIRVILPDSNKVKNWAGNGNIGTVDGFGSNSRFKGISKINYDLVNKRLLVAGYLNEGICRFVNTESPVVGTFVNAVGFQDGEFPVAKFTGPLSFIVDSTNKRYIMTDVNNQRIREIRWFLNTAPSCNLDTNLIEVFEDQLISGNQVVSGPISVGNTRGDTLQTYVFNVSGIPNNKVNTSTMSNSGGLTFSPSQDSIGIVRLKIILKDNGGTGSGGIDTSIYYKKIRIIGVNDAPRIQISGNDTALNTEPRIHPDFILGQNPGPFDESSQTLSSYSIAVNAPQWFSTLPYIENNALKFTPISGSIGEVAAYLKCKDNGGILNGGVDSVVVPFIIQLVNTISVAPELKQNVHLYPNPISSKFRIENLSGDCSKLFFYDLFGKKIEEIDVQSGASSFETTILKEGLYILKSNGKVPFSGIVSILKK